VESTLELCDYAQQNGNLPIIHENFDHTIDKKSLIGPTPLALRYAQEVTKEHKNFGLAVDLSHIPLIGEKPEQALPPIKDYLAAIDIGNCILADPNHPRYGDTHPRFGMPGGENDVPELVAFLKVLDEIEYFDSEERRVVSFEIRPFGEEDPEAYIAHAKRTLNEAWRQL
jgi:sugar phosphate isomerase/epimerase